MPEQDATQSSTVRRLRDVGLDDLSAVGGKAARLGDAHRVGCPVPPGVILTTELYRRFMRQGGLAGEIASILSTMQPTALAHFQAAEWAIRSAFAVRRVPDDVREAVAAALDELGAKVVVVRSSALNEDSPRQSFVGQHDTLLGVEGLDAAVEAVVACWLSLFSARALAYASRFQVDLLNSAMAVLIQPELPLDAQGSLFTADPTTGNPDVFLLECQCAGQPELYRLDPYNESEDMPSHHRALARLGLLLDERHERYQAIEWALVGDAVQVLRVRPLSRVPPYLPVSLRRGRDDRKPLNLVLPPNTPPREAQPYSWYHRSRSGVLTAAYYRERLKGLGGERGKVQFYLRGYLYERPEESPLPSETARLPTIMWLVLAAQRLWAARSLDRSFHALEKARRPQLEGWAQRDLGALDDRALASYLQELTRLNELYTVERGRLDDAAQGLCELFSRLHRRWVGGEAAPELIEVAGDAIARRDAAVARVAAKYDEPGPAQERAVADLRRRYGHLFLGGDPLGEQRDLADWRVDEEAFEEALRHPPQPRAIDRPKQAAGSKKISWPRRWIYDYVLRLAQRYVPLRADKDEPVLRCGWLEHLAVVEVGRRLQRAGAVRDSRDAFCLRDDELLDWLLGEMKTRQVAEVAQERRTLLRQWRRYAPPRTLGDQEEAPPPQPDDGLDGSRVMRGRAISPGVAQGRVCVVRSLSEATRVRPGDVLCSRTPLYDLSPWFGMASAVVTERGGLLDHAAVLVREYDVPAVFGVAGLLEAVRDGDTLWVDGGRGLVQPSRREHGWELL
ncbi:MAG: PEP/pyruvate-binding domain-containing protein [Anaerolineae bacterium]